MHLDDEIAPGTTVKLKEPWRGYRMAEVVGRDGYTDRYVVRLSSGLEIPVRPDEFNVQ